MIHGPSDRDWRRIQAINAAGIHRVRAAAEARQYKNIARDMQLLRRIAHSNARRAAMEFGVADTTASRILDRYYRLALELLAESVAPNAATKPSN